MTAPPSSRKRAHDPAHRPAGETARDQALAYKICPRGDWEAAQAAGAFAGAGIDLADGYIHLSTAEQVGETARLYFHGQQNLALLEVETAALGADLRYEASRGGALFPHLYVPLPVAAVRRVWFLTLDAAGAPSIPEL